MMQSQDKSGDSSPSLSPNAQPGCGCLAPLLALLAIGWIAIVIARWGWSQGWIVGVLLTVAAPLIAYVIVVLAIMTLVFIAVRFAQWRHPDLFNPFTNIQTRIWYNGRVAQIDAEEQQMTAAGKSLKELFETITRLRYEAQLQARELMQDQATAKSLPPPKMPEETLNKCGGDYEKAIEASKRTTIEGKEAAEDILEERGDRIEHMIDLLDHLQHSRVDWQTTKESPYIFQTVFQGKIVRLRLNEFPEEPLCTISIDGAQTGLDDLPTTWTLPRHRAAQ